MLTSKQRAYLRSLASHLDCIFQIGKSGISEETVRQISNALEARELIKLRTLDACEYTPKEAAEILKEQTGADVVTTVGSRIVLYRPSQKRQRIDLSNV